MAIYTIPELSYVGRTERELQEQGTDYVVGRARFADTARGQIIGEARGFMKILAARDTRALLGIHIIGGLKHYFIDRDGILASMLPWAGTRN